ERFFELVIFNYVYGNGDAHLKNFSLILVGDDYRLAPAYDLLNTCLHIEGSDFGLDEGLSRKIEKSDLWERTGHPCRLDFEKFGIKIGLVKKRIDRILKKFSIFPDMTNHLLNQSYLPEKAKRSYARIVKERINRFNRVSIQ
ncbi:MAG: HipA domain-containing protein, partial [Muribaculaceae bacterium]|nr:HipA domain-containing protein [Muribaculaceae bacterium]